MRSSESGWALNPMTGVPIRRSSEHTEETHTEGRRHVRMEAEIGGMQL